jgi:Zn-dependent M16 (insulinase) family peptidase
MKNFILKNSTFIEEIQSTLIELTHKKTKAKIMHILNDDSENLFSLSFQTFPSSSNGVFHILEHITLAGSKKFPIKDPFFSMMRRSLNTFMNAFTGNDFTCYPASSEVEKDFYNLLDVYIDAVFHPILSSLSFLQEGHRLEFTKIDDPKTPLLFKGVVFNEMKGALNSVDDRLFNSLFKKLTPNLPYAYNSGGDPKEIPNLSYEKLKKCHEIFYHPSKCLFFFYGNIKTEKHLKFLEEKVFKNVSTKKTLPLLKKQKRFLKPKAFSSSYPTAEKDLKNKDVIAFGFLTSHISNEADILALTLLDSILAETDASPLKFALLNSKLCQDVETYLDTEMSEVPFIIICKGTSPKNKDKIFKIIQKTLKEIKIPKKLIDAAMHQLEFSKTEITKSPFPYGLTLFFRAALKKQHGADPENALKIFSLFKSLKKDLQNKNFFKNLIEKYILKNKHFVTLTLSPDPFLEKKENISEKKFLEKIQKNLQPEDIKNIIKNSKRLNTQKFKESIECLPKIKIKDIPKKSKIYPLKKDFNVFSHKTFTNKITYIDFIFDLPKIDAKDLPYLSLLTTFITGIGAGKRNYKQNLEYINSYIGGLYSYISLNTHIKDPNSLFPTLSIKGKAFSRNTDKLFSLLKDMITFLDFSDEKRIKELFLQNYTFLINLLSENAMKYALLESLKTLSIPSFVNNNLFGLPLLNVFKENIKNLDSKIPKISEKLKNFSKKIFSQKNPKLIITSDEESYNLLKKKNFYDIFEFPTLKNPPFQKIFKIPKSPSSLGKIISSPVSFTSMSFKTIPYLHKDAHLIFLLTHILENKTLHPEIREKGGAYGARSSYNPINGVFNLYSYRDPNLKKTINTFKESIEKSSSFTKKDVEESIRQCIQSIDSPLSPGSKGITSYFLIKQGLTDKVRQNFREKLLLAKKEEIVKASLKHLTPQIKKAKIVSFAGEELFKREKTKLTIQSI